MDFSDYVAIISTLLTIISFVFNIIQLKDRKGLMQSIQSLIQSNYNIFFQIARCTTRARNQNSTKKDINVLDRALENIRGLTDAARSSLIATGRENFKFEPKYEHPAFPGKEVDDDVLYGLPPELQRKE